MRRRGKCSLTTHMFSCNCMYVSFDNFLASLSLSASFPLLDKVHFPVLAITHIAVVVQRCRSQKEETEGGLSYVFSLGSFNGPPI